MSKPSNPPKPPRSVSDAQSHLYVALWMYWYNFKTKFVPLLLAALLTVLSFVELIGPFTHLLPEQAMKIRIIIVACLVVTAILMLWHHDRLEKEIEQYTTLMSSVRVVLEDEADSGSFLHDPIEKIRVIKILDAIVFARQRGRKVKINASVLERKDVNPGLFSMYAQNRDSKFATEFTVPSDESVAGKVVEEGKRTQRALLYVPSVRFRHAVLITTEKNENSRAQTNADDGLQTTNQDEQNQIFRTSKVVGYAYAPVQPDGAAVLTPIYCLLCVQIPLKPVADANRQAVFCLSGQKTNSMNALDFGAARMAAILLSRVMSEPKANAPSPESVTSK